MWLNSILVAILIICVITDLKSRKIYNKVIFPGLLLAFISHLILGGWGGLLSSLIGFFVGFGLLLIPYLLGGMGAGDVKLLALVGAIKGTSFVLAAAVYMALIGALIAAAVLLCRKGMGERLKAFSYFLYGLRYGMKIPIHFNRGSLSASYPYGLAIAGGCLLGLLYNGWVL